MKNQIYSSNSSDSFLKDIGPYKLNNSDNSLKGKIVYKYSNISKTIIIGDKKEYGTLKNVGKSNHFNQNPVK